ncbi:MAG: RNA polymerase factor sigma-54 [Phycisphaerales bacterium]|nr:RNA polymerase factor sigma-54 [Phycisphaerales bacterium]
MMQFETNQHMKLGQQMKLSPRMIQSMEILQMPLLALQERVDQELESNIALDIAEGDGSGEVPEEGTEDTIDSQEMVVGEETDGADDFQRLESLETNYSEAMDNEYSSSSFSPSRQSGERDWKMDAMANLEGRGTPLADQLQHQWTFAEVDEHAEAAGTLLIQNITDEGLLGTDLETILEQNSEAVEQGMTLQQLEDTLPILQRWLEPAGLGARSTKECLLLQVEACQQQSDDSEDWEVVGRLIEEHMEDLVQNRLPRIASETGLTLDQVRSAMNLMHRLNLSPGLELVQVDVPPIIPDVIVEFDQEADAYIAALCDGMLPPLRVSPRYREMAKDNGLDKETRGFISRNVSNAQWLIESINQRSNSLLRVVNVVLSRQREFFDLGPQHLKPMPMVDVADQLGVHVATVSRAVADKWMQTPRGMIRLRRFFSGGTETESGRNVSWEAVKEILREIVEGEDRAHPLSDELLAVALKERGIDIARRTVVKYRQQMGIPPARLRKQF